MELSWSSGVGQKIESNPVQQVQLRIGIYKLFANCKKADIETIAENAECETQLGGAPTQRPAKEPSPWSCFYCSADVKVSEDAIKTLKSGKTKSDSEKPSNTQFHNYQQRKTFGQGMMDLALLTANVNQLRSLLDAKTPHPYYHANLTFIGISIFFQVIVGIGLVLNSRISVNGEFDVRRASWLNNWTFVSIFIITIANVFLTVFYDNK